MPEIDDQMKEFLEACFPDMSDEPWLVDMFKDKGEEEKQYSAILNNGTELVFDVKKNHNSAYIWRGGCNIKKLNNFDLVINSSTKDELAKLVSIKDRVYEGKLPKKFTVIGIDLRDMSSEDIKNIYILLATGWAAGFSVVILSNYVTWKKYLDLHALVPEQVIQSGKGVKYEAL